MNIVLKGDTDPINTEDENQLSELLNYQLEDENILIIKNRVKIIKF